MEPKFTGPAYTVGIEEELMILDPDTYALVNAIDDLLENSPDGEIKRLGVHDHQLLLHPDGEVGPGERVLHGAGSLPMPS